MVHKNSRTASYSRKNEGHYFGVVGCAHARHGPRDLQLGGCYAPGGSLSFFTLGEGAPEGLGRACGVLGLQSLGCGGLGIAECWS